ncbi:hypothetical protein C2S53_020574 [Perilla frutescens var. hirtella]|uniref:DUF7755 domain-containing protein n=1 Tax=Perilla frutescens var. hirtella TaxID=608512 RepID=A0AAD4JAK1_PERFH|nr:hypothetical protein C2S53_020574 [Perilla frutescens var. hirtella]
MELHTSKFLISPTHTKFPLKYSAGPNHTRILGINFRYFPLIIRSKKSRYQDFQEYAKPARLLPARGVRLWRDASLLETAFASSPPSKSESLYKVRVQTSKIYGSGLSDVNSGILLCLIDENGSSVLQRLPATWSEECDTLHFQRGSVDEFAFEGPHLGRILAVWISLESGEWRIGGIDLRVVSPLGGKNQETKYEFELEDILIGEKGEASMMEFRPHSVTAFSEDESTSTLLDENPPSPSNEESMEEYASLKLSLLFYDTVLILAGSAIASVSVGEDAAYAFLIGGLLGFAYLLLLQRSVDELPAPELVRGENGVSSSRVKGSVSIVVLVFAAVVVAVKYALGDYAVKLGPNDLIFGMMGFLMCKVSAVLAAFKPVPRS